MNTHSFHLAFYRQNIVPILVVLLSSLGVVFGLAASRAQSQHEGGSARGERRFENAIPQHVPIKVKLKSEKSFKDLNNKGWARELELEVKNTGSRPIHYLYVIILLPDSLLEDGISLGFRVSYGKSWLSEASTPLRPDETPIPPGESVTLKIRENAVKGFEMLREENKRTDPKRVRLVLQILDYGDGTGFESEQGAPLLYPPKKSSLDKSPAKESGGSCQPSPEERVRDSTVNFLKTASSSSEPASLLRVSFFLPEPPSLPAARARDLCGCQNTPNCFYGVITCPYQCPCDNHCDFQTHVATGSCSTPGGRCRQVELIHEDCPTVYNGIQKCSYDRIIGLCGEGDPTPTPPPTDTPTPTPTPTPEPTPDSLPPNETNCYWGPLPGTEVWGWQCFCLEGSPADYPRYGPTGCPYNTYNDGSDCCVSYLSGDCWPGGCPEGCTGVARRIAASRSRAAAPARTAPS
ncbi:MAG TPA: hypothetical protein VF659_00965 [Pyrinomonadaceae bacterium]|jgi:hypothetical protein